MSTNTPNEKGTPQSRTYTVNDIAAILGIGRASAYKLANSGLFKTIRIGNMIRISRIGPVKIYAQNYLQAPAE